MFRLGNEYFSPFLLSRAERDVWVWRWKKQNIFYNKAGLSDYICWADSTLSSKGQEDSIAFILHFEAWSIS